MTHITGKGLIEQNRYTSVPGSPQKLYRGRGASRQKDQGTLTAHREMCSGDVHCVYGEQASTHNSSSSRRRQLAALFFTALLLGLLVTSSGKKVLCWEPQHCMHSEEHILHTQRCHFMETSLMLCFFLFLFSVLLFLSSSRKQYT